MLQAGVTFLSENGPKRRKKVSAPSLPVGLRVNGEVVIP